MTQGCSLVQTIDRRKHRAFGRDAYHLCDKYFQEWND